MDDNINEAELERWEKVSVALGWFYNTDLEALDLLATNVLMANLRLIAEVRRLNGRVSYLEKVKDGYRDRVHELEYAIQEAMMTLGNGKLWLGPTGEHLSEVNKLVKG